MACSTYTGKQIELPGRNRTLVSRVTAGILTTILPRIVYVEQVVSL